MPYVPPPQALRSTVNSIDGYMPPAIICSIFCCAPLGIVAIVYAAQVKTKIEEGDLQSAMNASRKARKWYRASVFTSLGVFALYALLLLLGVMSAVVLSPH
jgi:hypothetical protein